jgi:hypothetical protein
MGLTAPEILKLHCYLNTASGLSGYCMLVPIAIADFSSLEVDSWNRMHDEDLTKTLVAIKSDLYLSTGGIQLDNEDINLQKITLRLTSLAVSCAGVTSFLATQKRIVDFIKCCLTQERGDVDQTRVSWSEGLDCLEERVIFLAEALNSEQQLNGYNTAAIQAQIQTVFL